MPRAKCQWCERIVDPQECFASPVPGTNLKIWICDCGEIIPGEAELPRKDSPSQFHPDDPPAK